LCVEGVIDAFATEKQSVSVFHGSLIEPILKPIPAVSAA
jgi:hypothetical protein